MKLKRRIVNNYFIRKLINCFRLKNLKRNFYSAKTNSIDSDSIELVYMANGFIKHGGLADRIYGILTTYAICKFFNIAFKCFYNSPYKLQLFLRSNNYDWAIDESKILYDANKVDVFSRMGGCSTVDFNFVSKIKRQTHLYSNYKWLNKINHFYKTNFTYKELFDELFLLSDSLEQDLKKMKTLLPQKYECIQIRVQNAFGDFPDCGSKELDGEGKEELVKFCDDKIKNRFNDVKLPIIITGDSESLLQILVERININQNIVYRVPGNISHCDNVSASGYEENKKTFLDLFVIAGAENIMQIKHRNIYSSGFSKLAADISGKNVLFI